MVLFVCISKSLPSPVDSLYSSGSYWGTLKGFEYDVVCSLLTCLINTSRYAGKQYQRYVMSYNFFRNNMMITQINPDLLKSRIQILLQNTQAVQE